MLNNILGAILAGGKAIRMNHQRKGLIAHPQNTNILNHIITQMCEAGIEDIIISANDPVHYGQFDKPMIADIHPEMGPLAGIEAVLQYAKNCTQKQAVLFMPSDMPAVNHKMITKLVDGFHESDPQVVYAASKTNGGTHPLCCIVRVDALEAIRNSLCKGHLRVLSLWKDIGCKTVEFKDDTVFLNINTPDDLSKWERML